MKTPCFTANSKLKLTVVNRDGDTLAVENGKTLNSLTKRYFCSTCGKLEQKEKNSKGLFRFRTRGLYRKYKAKREDFVSENRQ